MFLWENELDLLVSSHLGTCLGLLELKAQASSLEAKLEEPSWQLMVGYFPLCQHHWLMDDSAFHFWENNLLSDHALISWSTEQQLSSKETVPWSQAQGAVWGSLNQHSDRVLAKRLTTGLVAAATLQVAGARAELTGTQMGATAVPLVTK